MRVDDEYARWRCPRCDVPIMSLVREAGELCFQCEARLAWPKLSAPVRAEIDDLLRGDKVILAIVAMRERTGVDLPFAQGVVLERLDVLRKQGNAG